MKYASLKERSILPVNFDAKQGPARSRYNPTLKMGGNYLKCSKFIWHAQNDGFVYFKPVLLSGVVAISQETGEIQR